GETFGCCTRQQNKEDGAARRVVFDPDRSAMGFHNCARDGKSETKAFSQAFLSVFHLMERMEDRFFVGVFDSWTPIGNANQRDPVLRFLRRNPGARPLRHVGTLLNLPDVYADGPAPGGEAECVLE